MTQAKPRFRTFEEYLNDDDVIKRNEYAERGISEYWLIDPIEL